MVDGNGLITKDKFCYSRQTKLKLTWSRYEVWLKRKAKLSQNKPPEKGKQTGGEDEAIMAGEATSSCPTGRAAAMGSSLSTAIRMAGSDSKSKANRPKAQRATGGEKR
jgi:hypothetical protein